MIAKTILSQLGGNKFIVMTGAKNCQDHGRALSFRVPATVTTGTGINYVKITLEPSDTYTIEFGRVHGSKYRVIATRENIYADMLRDTFTDVTGALCTMGTLGR